MAYVIINGKKHKVHYESRNENEKGTTHVFAILDRSGSMAGLEKSTIDGYNGFVKELTDTDTRVTLTLFDDLVETAYAHKPVKDVPKLTKAIYYPRGMTALVDAVCSTINKYKSDVKKGDKAIVLIITDGLENASHEYTGKQMKDLIKGLDKKNNWTFTYLGANQDAWEVSREWGFRQGNVSTYRATDIGTRAAFATMSVNTSNFARSNASNAGDFYSKQDKDKLKKGV